MTAKPMNSTMATALRAEFPDSQIGKLPKVTCRDCSQSSTKVCQNHSKAKCTTCDNYMTGAHIHLDYCGHGAVTHRLLEVDPSWTWEPYVEGPDGLPLFTLDAKGNPIAFWIRLTVGDVTRSGCGTCPAGQFDAEKVLIGDALRNAAMRFGVALDLWIKGHGDDDEKASATDERTGPARQASPPVTLSVAEVARKDAGERIKALTPEHREEVKQFCLDDAIPTTPREWSARQLDEVIAQIAHWEAEERSGASTPDQATEGGTGDPGGQACACGSPAVGVFDGEALCDEHAPEGTPA